MLPCLSKQIFGMDCPGCGLQRSVVLLLKGELAESVSMYPGLLPMIVFFAFIGLDQVVRFRHGQRIIAWLGAVTAGVILINFILKTIH